MASNLSVLFMGSLLYFKTTVFFNAKTPRRQGFYCFEWEKVWHPELTDPEIAIADYARVVGGYLRQRV